MNLEHRRLVKRCIDGDRNAHYQLYHQYSKAMYNVALRLMKDRAEAEDILQNSFVDVFANLGRFRGDASLGSWIKRIVINNCLSELKKRKLFLEELEDKHVGVADEVQAVDDPDYSVQRIKQAMDLLPDGYRTVFSLYLLEGYDHAEISTIMGISEATSKSQLSRAKQKVKELVTAMV